MNELIDELFNLIFTELAAELNRQNHKLTGALEASFEKKIRKELGKVALDFIMNDYGLALNDGIKPSRIPYTPPPPKRGGKSKYIQGLIRWARIKFRYSIKRATSVAFAVARKHKQKGYPLTKRGFIDITLAANESKIEDFVVDWVNAFFEEFFKSFLEQIK